VNLLSSCYILKMIKINAFEQNFMLSLKTLPKFFMELNDIHVT